MKLSAIANNISDKAKKYTKDVHATYDNTVKPFVKEQYKYAKKMSKDTVDFVKRNPKKIGKYAAIATAIVAAGVGIVKGIKDYIETKKVNKILAKFVATEKQNNKELKDFIGIQREIIDSRDTIIDAQRKVIEEQKAKLGENNN